MKKKIVSVILMVVLTIAFDICAYADVFCMRQSDITNERITKAPPDLSCPNNCGNLGIIEDQFYDVTDYLLVYIMYCKTCDTHWYVIQEVNHFDSQPGAEFDI